MDMDSLSGSEGADRKIKGKTLHWVSAADAVPFEARLYDPLLADDSALEDEAEPIAEDAVDAEETEEAEEADANHEISHEKDHDSNRKKRTGRKICPENGGSQTGWCLRI